MMEQQAFAVRAVESRVRESAFQVSSAQLLYSQARADVEPDRAGD